jgi:hypothetical protein
MTKGRSGRCRRGQGRRRRWRKIRTGMMNKQKKREED